MIEQKGIRIDKVLVVELSNEEIERRLASRRTCKACGASFNVIDNKPKVEGVCDVCGDELIIRDDDRAEVVRARLNTYHELTEPILEFYRGKAEVTRVSAEGEISEAEERVRKALGE